MKRIGWIVWDGQALRLRSLPKRYGGQVLVEHALRDPAAQARVQAAWDRQDPGELSCSDPWVKPGSVDDGGRWTLISGRQVWPL